MAIKQTQQPLYFLDDQWQSFRSPGMRGLNTIVDPHDIGDQDASDLLNVWFDQGVIGTRPGSILYASKPASETGTPSQLMVPKTSDGVNYLIAVYTSGTNVNNFYVYDVTNTRWVLINGTYGPSFSKTLYFGSQSWTKAVGQDMLYFGNGYDNMGRWQMAMNYLSSAILSSNTTLPLTDATRFYQYSAGITAVNADNTTVTLSTSPQADSFYLNSWELGQPIYYVGTGITGLTTGTIYYAVPSAYSLASVSSLSGNTLGFATTKANAIAKTTISISGSPSNATVYKLQPIVVYDGTTTTNMTYYSVTSNTLNLVGTAGQAYASGATVVPTITDRPGMPKGNVLATWQGRFVTASSSASQQSIYDSSSITYHTWPTVTTTIPTPTTIGANATMFQLSRTFNAEDFVPNTNDGAASFMESVPDGSGAIVDIKDFGQFLLISKSNSQWQFSYSINQTTGAQVPQLVPIISGIGSGPLNSRGTIKAMNSIFYPTASAGFISMSPLQSGFSVSTGYQVISNQINNYIQNGYDFTVSKGQFYYNKLFWTATNPNTQSKIFMYDTVRQAWSIFDNWNPVDMAVTNTNQFYYLAQNGNVYKAFQGYTDNSNPYNSYYTTKLHNFGQPAIVKTLDAIYIEGYMTQSTILYADVLYNEKGNQYLITYKITTTTAGVEYTSVTIGGMGSFPFYQSILDSFPPSQIQNFGYFRGYLSVPNAYGFHALQVKFYSKNANSVWFLTGYGMNPKFENNIPSSMRIDSTSPVVTNFQ